MSVIRECSTTIVDYRPRHTGGKRTHTLLRRISEFPSRVFPNTRMAITRNENVPVAFDRSSQNYLYRYTNQVPGMTHRSAPLAFAVAEKISFEICPRGVCCVITRGDKACVIAVTMRVIYLSCYIHTPVMHCTRYNFCVCILYNEARDECYSPPGKFEYCFSIGCFIRTS